jgi:hypothetical protein
MTYRHQNSQKSKFATDPEQVRRLLGYETRLEVHAFLKEHDVPLRYTLEDLKKDREARRRLGL